MKKALDFLKILSENNNRDWFNSHKADYEKALNEMILFADDLLGEMKKHDVLDNVNGKKSLFRIYRDVRFSKDKRPYKTHWGLFFKRSGASRRGGYYLHLSPGDAYAMGGFFNPNKEDLLHIRNQLSLDSGELRKIINSKNFKSTFGELIGDKLKTSPRGFEKDHPDLDLLRYKQFLVRSDFTKTEVNSPDFPKIVSKTFEEMRSFFDYMSEILTSDLNGEILV